YAVNNRATECTDIYNHLLASDLDVWQVVGVVGDVLQHTNAVSDNVGKLFGTEWCFVLHWQQVFTFPLRLFFITDAVRHRLKLLRKDDAGCGIGTEAKLLYIQRLRYQACQHGRSGFPTSIQLHALK